MSSERATIMRHAGTVMVGQLAVMAFSITDTLVAGHFADTALAGLAVASATYVTVHISLMGMLQALLPVWAELHGAQRDAEVGRSVRQALYLCAITASLGMWALLCPDFLLNWTQVPVDLQAEVRGYLNIVAFGLPASLLFRMYSTLNQSLGKPKLVTWVQVGALIVKVPLSIALVLGIPHVIPPLGLAGCAWATLAVTLMMISLALWLLRTQDFYKPYRIWAPMEKPHATTLLRFVRLGLPSGLAIGVEVTSFTLMSLFIARLGVVATASHQIVSNMTAVLYMIPLSLSIASSSRVSYWIGAGQIHRARQALRTGLSLVLLLSLSLAGLIGWQHQTIAQFYTQSPEVAGLAATLLLWLMLYHVADAVQVFCVFTLRCYGITVLPLITYTVLLWGLGLAGGYVVAYGAGFDVSGLTWLTPQSPIAFWQTGSLALYVTTAVLLPVLWRAAYRPTHTSLNGETMNSIKIYHNPKCSNSRNALALLREHGHEPEVILYLDAPPTRQELQAIIQATGGSARALMRSKETVYSELGLDNPKLTEETLMDAMLAHPVLMNRPIVITAKGTRLCRPPELVLEILPPT